MSKKTTDIVAYLSLIGWVIAFVAGDRMRSRFHLNQALVIILANVFIGIISRFHGIFTVISWVLNVILLVLWLIGFVAAIQGQEKKVPILGEIVLLK